MKQQPSVVMLGGGGVGKSSLTLRLITQGFVDEYDATIEDSYRKVLEVDNEVYNMEVVDTAGQEEFSSLIDSWVRPADGVIFVFDVSSRHTFEEVQNFYDRVVMCKDTSQVPMVLVGNKCDLPDDRRQVKPFEGHFLANGWGCPYIEASARERINDLDCFSEIVRQINRHEKQKPKKKGKSFCAIL